jgi:predicted MFS family arabinose efflux permease
MTMPTFSHTRLVLPLGLAQTLAWGSSYYLPAMLATPMSHTLGVAPATVFSAFSITLVVSAIVGPIAGRAIDQHGGRSVLIATNFVFAVGLVMLGLAQGTLSLFIAWAVLGVAMGSGLYEAAFAALVRLQGTQARTAITGITLIAGFASTVSWPLTALIETEFGWRAACVGWAVLHVILGAPLNASMPRAAKRHPEEYAPEDDQSTMPAMHPKIHRPVLTATLLSFVFAVTYFIATAMATHLPRLLQAGGMTLAAAVAIGALVGPAQVAARVLEFSVLRRVHPLLSARLAAIAHPLGAIALLIVGTPAALLFVLLHGAGNGMLTIAKGTLPLVIFGPHGYGARQGWMTMPARIAQALAPWLFGLALDRWGAPALGLCAVGGAASFVALMSVRTPR